MKIKMKMKHKSSLIVKSVDHAAGCMPSIQDRLVLRVPTVDPRVFLAKLILLVGIPGEFVLAYQS